MKFAGSYTALITPFLDGRVDERAFQNLVEWQIAEGTDGLVPTGTTGESPTLSHDEHRRVVELCIEVAKGRSAVLAGTGSNSTEEAISLTHHAAKAGADAALVVAPYYNKPTQAGLYAHYRAIHDATDIPIFIYNIPGRSVVDMSVETMRRLGELPRIVGVKDATADARGFRRGICPIFWRRHHDDPVSRARRRRLHFGYLEHRAQTLRGFAPGLATRRSGGGDADQYRPGTAPRRALRRNQPRAGEICRIVIGTLLADLASAACRARRRGAPSRGKRHARNGVIGLTAYIHECAEANR